MTKAVELLSELGLAFLFLLDVVLGAFAAGFILRFVTPNGNHTLNLKLEGVGYGFLIPVFFVVSGASIDVKAVVANPALLITFIIMLPLVRAVPILWPRRSTIESTHSTRRISSPFRCILQRLCR